MDNKEFEQMVVSGIKKTLEQGEPCMTGEGVCSYKRGNLRCAVGHMMNDKELSEFGEIEGSVYDIHVFGWRTELTDNQLRILNTIQNAHDNEGDFYEDFNKGFIGALKLGGIPIKLLGKIL